MHITPDSIVYWQMGPVRISATLVFTWVVMGVLVLGSWLVSVVPADVVAVVQTYILPSVLGAVLVQAVVSTRNLRMTVIAGVVSTAVVFLLVPTVPTLAFFGTAIAVIATAVLAWFLRDRSAEADPVAPQPEASTDDLRIG